MKFIQNHPGWSLTGLLVVATVIAVRLANALDLGYDAGAFLWIGLLAACFGIVHAAERPLREARRAAMEHPGEGVARQREVDDFRRRTRGVLAASGTAPPVDEWDDRIGERIRSLMPRGSQYGEVQDENLWVMLTRLAGPWLKRSRDECLSLHARGGSPLLTWELAAMVAYSPWTWSTTVSEDDIADAVERMEFAEQERQEKVGDESADGDG